MGSNQAKTIFKVQKVRVDVSQCGITLLPQIGLKRTFEIENDSEFAVNVFFSIVNSCILD